VLYMQSYEDEDVCHPDGYVSGVQAYAAYMDMARMGDYDVDQPF